MVGGQDGLTRVLGLPLDENIGLVWRWMVYQLVHLYTYMEKQSNTILVDLEQQTESAVACTRWH
jgi:hypothetical protein